jgi:glycosyltransferase involved in cell wall biosynthesis
MVKITLAMPSYNQNQFLEDAIKSVIEQEYPNLEFVVRDGGSTDGSIKIIKKYKKSITRWVSEPDDGQAAAINRVWESASGTILGWLNSDDVLVPGALHKVARAAQEYPESVLLYGDCKVIDKDGNHEGVVRTGGLDLNELLLGKAFPQPSVFIRQRVVEEVGLLDPSLHYALDWAYFLKIVAHFDNSKIQHIPSVLSGSREYEGTKTRTGFVEQGEERREKIREYIDTGVLSADLQGRALAGTYWRQGASQFLAGKYSDAVRSGLKATRYDPSSLLEKAPRLLWLLGQRYQRR